MSCLMEQLEHRTLPSAVTVDSAGVVGENASLAINTLTGQPEIAYYDETHGNLKLAARSQGKWTTFTVASHGNVGRDCCLKFNSAGEPCISYIDATHRTLVYAQESHRRWSFQTIDTAQESSTSLAIDSNDQPHIAYAQNQGAGIVLRYASFDGVGWTKGTAVEGTSDDPSYVATPSLALDSFGRPHIAFYDGAGDTLGYAVFDGSSWSNQTLDTGEDFSIGLYPSLVLDASDRPYISYDGDGMGTSATFFLTAPDGTNFSDHVVLPQGDGFDTEKVGETSIALAPDGRPRIAYENGGASPELLLGTGNRAVNATTFTRKVLDHIGNDSDGDFPSLAIAAKGIVYLAYFDPAKGDLKFYTTG